MAETKVALERQADGSFNELGIVVSSTNSAIEIRDAGGRLQKVTKKGLMTPRFGSFNHLLRARTQELEVLAQADPLRVAKQLVADSTKGIGARELRLKFSEALASGIGDADWKKVVRQLKEDEEVKVAGQPAQYKIAHGVTLSLLSDPSPAPVVEASGHAQEVATEVAPPSDTSENTHKAPVVTGGSELLGYFATAELGLGSMPFANLGALTRELLEVATALQPKQLDELEHLEMTDQERAAVAAILLARGRKLLGDAPLIPSELVQIVLAQAVRAKDGKVERVATTFAERGVAAAMGWSPTSLHDTAATLLRWPGGKPPPRAVEALLEVYIAAIESFRPRDLEQNAYQPVAHLAQRVPLLQKGVRARLIAAVGRYDATIASDPAWWEGTFAELADLAGGVAGVTLELPEVVEGIARPRVIERLGQAQSRQALALVIGAPYPLACHADAGAVASAWARIAGSDPLAAGWLDRVQDRSRIKELVEARESAEAESVAAREQAVGLEREMKQQAQQLERLTKQLSDATARSDNLNAVGLEQARMDVLKSFATLAALALDGATQHGDGGLEQKVVFQASREGLDVGDELGTEVPFDPTVHDTLGEGVKPGSIVVVTRRGYDLVQTTGDRLVLVKSHVVAR